MILAALGIAKTLPLRIELGNSDLNIKGNVRHIGGWFRHKKILEGELDIVSDHCDANQLMAWFSADEETSQESGAESQESKAESQEELTSTPEQNTPDSTKEMEPFMVPLDVDLALNTNLKEVEIFNQLAKDLKGGIFMQEGNLILDEVGFVCRAAKLQLTAMYRSPRRNHLYLGMDYHMVDVDIDELLTMIPNLEEMVPMLSSFKGAAEFHLAAETYLNSQYQPKMSTLRGAASLTGKDLVVLDGETFELFGEGFRWFDLVRTGRLGETMPLEEKYTRFPIPARDLGLNQLLEQNPLWKASAETPENE